MTWQCDRCKVEFREERPRWLAPGEAPAQCSEEDCGATYFDKIQSQDGGVRAPVGMYLVSRRLSPTMEEYRSHYERDFGQKLETR